MVAECSSFLWRVQRRALPSGPTESAPHGLSQVSSHLDARTSEGKPSRRWWCKPAGFALQARPKDFKIAGSTSSRPLRRWPFKFGAHTCACVRANEHACGSRQPKRTLSLFLSPRMVANARRAQRSSNFFFFSFFSSRQRERVARPAANLCPCKCARELPEAGERATGKRLAPHCLFFNSCDHRLSLQLLSNELASERTNERADERTNDRMNERPSVRKLEDWKERKIPLR